MLTSKRESYARAKQGEGLLKSSTNGHLARIFPAYELVENLAMV